MQLLVNYAGHIEAPGRLKSYNIQGISVVTVFSFP